MTDKEKHIADNIIAYLMVKDAMPEGVKMLHDTAGYLRVWNKDEPLPSVVYDHIVSHFKKEMRRDHSTAYFNKLENALQVFENEVTVGG